MKPFPTKQHGDSTCGIQTEKQNAGDAVVVDVRADIEFRESRNARYTRQKSWTHGVHQKRHQPQVCFSVKEVEFKGRWNHGLKGLGVKAPV